MQRNQLVVPFEVKQTDDDTRTFEGYGSVFGVVDSYADVVANGAFKRSLREWKAKGRTPAMLWQHNPAEPVGVWTALSEDETGLLVKGKLLTTGRGPQAYEALKEGALSGLSIGFRTLKSKMDDETGIRTLTEVELWEVSLVTFPANDPARVSAVKTIFGDSPDPRRLEEWFRCEAGLSKSDARRAVHHYFDRLCEADDRRSSPSDPVRGRVEGSQEALIALRSALSGVPPHGAGSQGADRSDRP